MYILYSKLFKNVKVDAITDFAWQQLAAGLNLEFFWYHETQISAVLGWVSIKTYVPLKS